jgi:hypothetical protein
MSNIDAIDHAAHAMKHAPAASPLIGQKPNPWFNVLAAVVVIAGIIYAGIHLANDLSVVRDTRAYPYILLGIALLIALGFEFVNGFHDTANAVATVIYTNSLSPNLAVVWSGFFNFLGVLFSTGAVAFGIVSLLPVELILQVGSGAGFAMVFAFIEFAYFDRIHHRRRTHESADGGESFRHQRSGLEPGNQNRRNPASFTADRLQRGLLAAHHSQGDHQDPCTVQRA